MSSWNPGHWHWPQVVMLSIVAANVVIAATRDGEPRKRATYDFPTALVGAAISLWIIWAGGFFA